MVFPAEVGKARYQYCYVSFDSGKTWDPVLQLTEGYLQADPTIVYGSRDDLYALTLMAKDLNKPRDLDPNLRRFYRGLVVYKSTDAGRNWTEASRLPYGDRPFIGFDNTKSKYSGRLYVAAEIAIPRISGEGNSAMELFRSLDGGNTFLGPVVAEYPDGMHRVFVGTGAVLSDGTFVVMFGLTKKGRGQNLEQEPLLGPNCELHVISTRDGGETFEESQKITDWTVDYSRSPGGLLGQLVVDPGSKQFRDRLYAVWPAIVSDRIQIQSSYSTDKGKTWSRPVTVNDDRSPQQVGKGPDHMLPSIAVNKDGVVLVTWYDRRDAKDNLGWNLRAAASLDGGETFSASVPATDNASAYSPFIAWDLRASRANTDQEGSLVSLIVDHGGFFYSGGHTSGLAADADGAFHPTWIDNHTGIAQLWSTSIKVAGLVVEHGSVDLAKLNDISKFVTLELSERAFDRETGALTLTVQVKNRSKEAIEGPVIVRVLTLESELGLPEISNADNGQNGTGAIWNFSENLSGNILPSLALSTPKTLKFHVSNLYPVGQGRDIKSQLVNLDVRVFGRLRKEKTDGINAK